MAKDIKSDKDFTLESIRKKNSRQQNGRVDNKQNNKDEGPQKSKTREYADALLYAAVVAFIIKILLFEAYRIPTGSMENTLLVGDFLLVTKFTYGATSPRNVPFTDIRLPYFKLPGFKDPKVGDIIVFDFPGQQNEVESKEVTNYIKRCVGTPGDSIQVINKALYINGQQYPNPPESKFDRIMRQPGQPSHGIYPPGSQGWNEDNYGPVRVPKAGDVIKIDSASYRKWEMFVRREGHNIELRNGKDVFVDGAALTDGNYTVKRDYLFMMGDNRNNSLDSRFWGFMPVENVVGEAFMVYWSWDANIPMSDFFDLLGSIRWGRIGQLIK